MKKLLFAFLLVGTVSFGQQYQDDCLDNLEFPASFTPNGDTHNDAFRIHFDCPPEKFSIAIINRWGEEVFTSDQHDFEWDGTYKDVQLGRGTYVWVLEFTFNGAVTTKNGNVQMLR